MFVSRRTLMGYPSVYPKYARNRACALPSPSSFHYVMAKIVPVVQLAAHAKSSTLYGRTVERSYNQIFLAKWVTTILYSYGATLCVLRYKDKRWWRFRRKATLFLEKREQPLFYPGAAGGICCIKIIFS